LDGFLKFSQREWFREPGKLTGIPTTGYCRLFIARLNYSSFVAVHPAPKFAGRRADISVAVGCFATGDNVVLDIGDEEKLVANRERSDRVLTEKV
jgi:hypothetical protein